MVSTQDGSLLDINKASQVELESLPGIGKVKAQSILEQRSILGFFTSLDDLLSIGGITRQRLNNLRLLLTCNSLSLQSWDNPKQGPDQNKGTTMKRKLINSTNSSLQGSSSSSTSLPSLNATSPEKRKRNIEHDNSCNTSDTHLNQFVSKHYDEKVLSSSMSSLPNLNMSVEGKFNVNNGVPMNAVSSCTVRRRLHSQASPNPVKIAEEEPEGMQTWLDTFQKWNADERIVALDAFIKKCDMSIVRHIMAQIEPHFQRDFISLLPRELALYVLAFLEPKDLCRAAQTCRYWRILAEDTLLWREKCVEYEMDIDTNGPELPYKVNFLKQHKIEMNWRCRPLLPAKHLRGHDDHVITCLQFDGNRIISASDDNTLKVWCATTGKLEKTLQGHTGGVWSSLLNGDIVVSGSTDRTLRVWDASTGNCLHVLNGHTSTVRCLAMHGEEVVSGSRDGTLRIWNIKTGECLKILIGHAAAVRCVQFDGNFVVSGAYDYLVKIWDAKTEACLHTLTGHSNRVYSLQFDRNYIVSGSLDTSIRVWNATTGELRHSLLGHQSLTSGMVLKDNKLVSGNADSTVKVWDIVTGKCLHTLNGPNKHQSAVTSLQFNKKFVVTSSDDGSVKLWDIKTGDFIRDLVVLESGGSGGVVWRVKCNDKKLVCAVGSRNGTEETKLLVQDFDVHNEEQINPTNLLSIQNDSISDENNGIKQEVS